MVKIRDVEVDFPFKPYECQVAYMEKVITCLQEGKNGILESPTGTGKTLCLLCATLAWREAFAAKNQLHHNINADALGDFQTKLLGDLNGAVGNNLQWEETEMVSTPKIVYASRTHSQLSQVVAELKNTAYKPKVTVLGSRDQLCINPEVISQDTNTAKVHMCKTKVNTRSCSYYNNLEEINKTVHFQAITEVSEGDYIGTGRYKA